LITPLRQLALSAQAMTEEDTLVVEVKQPMAPLYTNKWRKRGAVMQQARILPNDGIK